jgi:hypothetical protein
MSRSRLRDKDSQPNAEETSKVSEEVAPRTTIRIVTSRRSTQESRPETRPEDVSSRNNREVPSRGGNIASRNIVENSETNKSGVLKALAEIKEENVARGRGSTPDRSVSRGRSTTNNRSVGRSQTRDRSASRGRAMPSRSTQDTASQETEVEEKSIRTVTSRGVERGTAPASQDRGRAASPEDRAVGRGRNASPSQSRASQTASRNTSQSRTASRGRASSTSRTASRSANRDSSTSRTNSPTGNRSKSRSRIIDEPIEKFSDLRVFATGIRDGELITSAPREGKKGEPANSGTVMRVRGFYPPSARAINNMSDRVIRDAFNHVDFFSGMSFEERLKWLNDNKTEDPELYMDESSLNLEVRFLEIGGEGFLGKDKLSEEQIDELIAGNPDDEEGYYRLDDVLAMFTGKEGSKGVRGRFSLVFRPGLWVLKSELDQRDSFDGVYFNLDTYNVVDGVIERPQTGFLRVYKSDRLPKLAEEYAIYTTKVRKTALTWDTLLDIAGDKDVEMLEIKELISWFIPSLHKSLIQKLIRTRCRKVSYQGKEYNSDAVLLTSLSLLMLHPGAFVENVQRFITGMESSFKRLSVSINEDSFTADGRDLAMLYSCGMLAQQDKKWFPTDSIIKDMFDIAIEAQKDPRMFDYDCHTSSKVSQIDDWSFSYLMLAELRSFNSDICMLSSIAANQGKPREVQDLELIPVMPLSWAIDMHVYTEIGRFLPYTGASFKEIFKSIWNNCTGVNPRNKKYKDWDREAQIVKDINKAQRQLWLSKTTKPVNRAELKEGTKLSFSLDSSWLSGMLSVIDVKVGQTDAIVVLRPEDIYSFIAVKKPPKARQNKKRDDDEDEEEKKKAELTDEEKEAAIRGAVRLLQKGIVLKSIPSTLSHFKGATVYLQDYNSETKDPVYELLMKDNQYIDWEDARHLEYYFPFHEPVEHNIDAAIAYTGEGIEQNAEIKLNEYLDEMNSKTLRRLSTYLDGSHSIIQMHKIGRKGEKQELSVIPEDALVFQFLCKLCCLYPGALEKKDVGFAVKVGPLMWSVRDKIASRMRKQHSTDLWEIPPPDKRKMYEHQQDMVESLKERYQNGKHGSLIWAPVGVGKSLVVTNFIHWLIEKDLMPKFAVWSLPKSAIKSIAGELELSNLPYQIMDMTKNGENQTINPFEVAIIQHDHMRLNGADEELREKASNMFFICDEFHRAFNKSIRTSITLDILQLSAHFCGLSATIIKDGNEKNLIPWLENVTEFEINKGNYLVSMASLISKKIVLPIKVTREYIEAPMLDKAGYLDTVPSSLGGKAKNLHPKEALKYCYDSIIQEMVLLTQDYYKIGEGVFLVAKDSRQQQELKSRLEDIGITRIFLITKDEQANLTAKDRGVYDAIITTKTYAEGYNLTAVHIMISPVYYSNAFTRDQLEGRIFRIGQEYPIRYITVHCGILSYILDKYEHIRQVGEVVKGFADKIGGFDVKELQANM